MAIALDQTMNRTLDQIRSELDQELQNLLMAYVLGLPMEPTATKIESLSNEEKSKIFANASNVFARAYKENAI